MPQVTIPEEPEGTRAERRLMADDTNEEPLGSDLVEFAAEVRQIGAEIIAAVDSGHLDQVKALTTYLCMAATLIEQAGSETDEIDPYDLARLKFFRDSGTSAPED
jgi:hypothetical protein